MYQLLQAARALDASLLDHVFPNISMARGPRAAVRGAQFGLRHTLGTHLSLRSAFYCPQVCARVPGDGSAAACVTPSKLRFTVAWAASGELHLPGAYHQVLWMYYKNSCTCTFALRTS